VRIYEFREGSNTYGTHKRHINGNDLVIKFSDRLATPKNNILTLLRLEVPSLFDETPEYRRRPLEGTIRLVFTLRDIGLETGDFLGGHCSYAKRVYKQWHGMAGKCAPRLLTRISSSGRTRSAPVLFWVRLTF
jgi:hypothetical protein